jgi:hypothetical protein
VNSPFPQPGECLVGEEHADGSESNGPTDSSSLEDEPTDPSPLLSIMGRVSECDSIHEGDHEGRVEEEEIRGEQERCSAEKIQHAEGFKSSSMEDLGKHVAEDVHSKVLL